MLLLAAVAGSMACSEPKASAIASEPSKEGRDNLVVYRHKTKFWVALLMDVSCPGLSERRLSNTVPVCRPEFFSLDQKSLRSDQGLLNGCSVTVIELVQERTKAQVDAIVARKYPSMKRHARWFPGGQMVCE